MAELRGLLIDLDGTIYSKGAAIPGAAQAIAALRSSGKRLLFLTNTDSKSSLELADQLVAMGIEVAAGEIMTSVDAGAAYVREHGGRAFCLLPEHLKAQCSCAAESEAVQYVVVGDCRSIDGYQQLNTAFRHLMAGAELLALQKGRYVLSPEGFNIDTGAFVALLEYAAGKEARVLGKPSPSFFQAALQRIGVSAAEAAVVGDDLFSDIAGAAATGLRSVLVQTGKAPYQQRRPSDPQPTHTIGSIADLPSLLNTIT